MPAKFLLGGYGAVELGFSAIAMVGHAMASTKSGSRIRADN
jgi:hypothetical protein